jgi:hypothetical protein
MLTIQGIRSTRHPGCGDDPDSLFHEHGGGTMYGRKTQSITGLHGDPGFYSFLVRDLLDEPFLEVVGSRNRLFGAMRSLVHPGRRNSLRRSQLATEDATEAEATARNHGPAVAGVIQHLGEAVLDLAEPYRAVILLRYHERLSIRDIAANLHIPAGTVKTRLKVARTVLRQSLDDAYHGDREAWNRFLASLLQGERPAD